ncbi:small cysteine-rich outer membrane protein [Chlamydia sp. 17-3921]|uniref:small cysteine-rich outer membrane protein n=1 Tax=Chlamydia sp. 17-3921 TaxID=2675798 RepID=UPI001918F3BE|nr:small cysteine-rich outer membrane protein [Chlamydia sp. 17-3921]
MKKAVLIAAIFGLFSLSSCCRIIDCCFEDPCSLPSVCNPCKNSAENNKSHTSKPCGSDQHTNQIQGPQAKGCNAYNGGCK